MDLKKRCETLWNECLIEADRCNIPYAETIQVRISTGTHRYWGTCRKIENEKFTVTLSEHLFAGDDKAVKTTMLHELIHTCAGCGNHGIKWKNYATRLNGMFGYDIKRTTGFQEKGLNPEECGYSYLLQCEKCKTITGYHRLSTYVKHPEVCKCSKCGGAIVRIK